MRRLLVNSATAALLVLAVLAAEGNGVYIYIYTCGWI